MTQAQEIIKRFGLSSIVKGGALEVHSPLNNEMIAALSETPAAKMPDIAQNAQKAFHEWKIMPAPVRGEFVRLLGEELRAAKDDLGQLVTLECGKILSEGLGEVQEMIDICDFAVGLSRQLYGLTIASERPDHHMREVWHPIGPVGIISAFNFPVAVWAWNAALALVCGNSLVWKPSEKTPVTALACEKLFQNAAEKFRKAGHECPENLLQVLIGQRELGEKLAADKAYPLISATGSTAMGRSVNTVVAQRLGRSLLELGGNNAMIVTPTADLDMAVRAILFGAVGTCGQRCTTLRRLIVHESVANTLKSTLAKAYGHIRIGNPLESETLVGPLIDEQAWTAMEQALIKAKEQGGVILTGGKRYTDKGCDKGAYVTPALVEMPEQTDIVRHETFAPILYIITYKNWDEALAMQNDVPQGLSSCIFTNDIREAETFVSAQGSDCGIPNVNIGTSGAEIGGAFGGEKETGGGRESGSDSWKAYMRRQTQTVNYSSDLPLAQGVVFEI